MIGSISAACIPLRGFEYRSISLREPGYAEPVGGNSYWSGSVDTACHLSSRRAARACASLRSGDIGSVGVNPWSFNAGNFSDNWGLGLRLNIPATGTVAARLRHSDSLG